MKIIIEVADDPENVENIVRDVKSYTAGIFEEASYSYELEEDPVPTPGRVRVDVARDNDGVVTVDVSDVEDADAVYKAVEAYLTEGGEVYEVTEGDWAAYGWEVVED